MNCVNHGLEAAASLRLQEFCDGFAGSLSQLMADDLGHPVIDVDVFVKGQGVRGLRLRGQERLSRPIVHGQPAPGAGYLRLPAGLAEVIVVVEKGELCHRIIAPLPLGGPLPGQVRKEDALAVLVQGAGFGFLAQAVAVFRDGVRAILPIRPVPGIELSAQDAAPQGAQGVPFNPPPVR